MHSSQGGIVHMSMRVDETGRNDLVRAVDYFNTCGWCDIWGDLRDPITFDEDIRFDAFRVVASLVDNNNAILEECSHSHCGLLETVFCDS